MRFRIFLQKLLLLAGPASCTAPHEARAPEPVQSAPAIAFPVECNDPAELEKDCPTQPGACEYAALSFALCATAPRAEERASGFAALGCSRGSAESCKLIEWLSSGGLARVRSELALREARAAEACATFSAEACRWRAMIQGFRGDDAGAVDWFASACSMDDAEGCFVAGASLTSEHSKLRDSMRGFTYLQRSCELGRCDGCRRALGLALSVEALRPRVSALRNGPCTSAGCSTACAAVVPQPPH
jgi:hypothetical protein